MVQMSVGGIIANRMNRVLGLRARYASKSIDNIDCSISGIAFVVKGIRFSSGGKKYPKNELHEMGDTLEVHVSISVLNSQQIHDFSIILCPISVARC